VVSVPVLSVQMVSTAAMLSTAVIRWTIAPRRLMTTAPSENAMVAVSTSPWGTMLVTVMAISLTNSVCWVLASPMKWPVMYAVKYAMMSATAVYVSTPTTRLMTCCSGLWLAE
jgi:hypothetical protein